MVFITDAFAAVGAMVGLAVGDAMGAPLEGLPPPPVRVRKMTGGGIHGTRPGQFTDDTLQACAVAESLVYCRGFDPCDLLRRLLRGYRRHPEFFGPTSRAVLDRVAWGWDPVSAAAAAHRERGSSRSNGSVMRGAPLGIFYGPARIRPVSLACSALTHHDPAAGECSAFINRMVSGLCRGEDGNTAYHRACRAVRDPKIATVLASSTGLPLRPSLDALETAHSAARILLTTRSFSDAVVTAINQGGDADTLGAVVGALAGARYGIRAIPPDWLAGLDQHDRIIETGIRLWTAGE
ncbi:MAG: ADP-ribosylglycohydrolase family protein [Methanomicrobiales archaeon]